MDFRFTNEYPLSRLDEIIAYLLGPRLWIPQSDYPDFEDWAERSYKELLKESKRAIIALHNREMVGVLIYQKHKKHDNVLELKNLTVRPDKRGRHIASFLLRSAEIEGAKEFKTTQILCDAKADNFQMRSFLMKNHYRILGREALYNLGAGEDLIYHKSARALQFLAA